MLPPIGDVRHLKRLAEQLDLVVVARARHPLRYLLKEYDVGLLITEHANHSVE